MPQNTGHHGSDCGWMKSISYLDTLESFNSPVNSSNDSQGIPSNDVVKQFFPFCGELEGNGTISRPSTVFRGRQVPAKTTWEDVKAECRVSSWLVSGDWRREEPSRGFFASFSSPKERVGCFFAILASASFPWFEYCVQPACFNLHRGPLALSLWLNRVAAEGRSVCDIRAPCISLGGFGHASSDVK